MKLSKFTVWIWVSGLMVGAVLAFVSTFPEFRSSPPPPAVSVYQRACACGDYSVTIMDSLRQPKFCPLCGAPEMIGLEAVSTGTTKCTSSWFLGGQIKPTSPTPED